MQNKGWTIFQYRKRLKSIIALVTMGIIAAGCTNNDLALRRSRSSRLALEAGWIRTTLDVGKFSLIAFTPHDSGRNQVLTIYIEGDGLAWIDFSTPSFDRTPINPLGLRLAMLDPHQSVAYLARPCQFTQDNERRNCDVRYWTSHRFAPEVIEATDLAVTQLKARSGAKQIRMIGYSGGGAVAALVSARRNDVTMLVTVAGNLDHVEWTRINRVTPLFGSLNAADYWQALQHIPQQHYVGGRDHNIDESIARSYASRFSESLSITVLPDFTHLCCWEKVWPALVSQNFGLPDAVKSDLNVIPPR
jgi:hypothetical protein